VERQLASGNYASADEVVCAGLRLLAELQENEADLEELRRLIAEGDADIAAGRVHRYANADELTADIVAREEADSRKDAEHLSTRLTVP
jgi:antitoxin ParD1/3/4